jgi:glutathione S-transferase
MITLHQFPTALGVPNLSPYCMKVETWLRLAGLDYEIRWTPNPGNGPKGKLPFIKDGDKIIADSQNIIEHLERAHGVNLDAGLSAEQKAVAHAFTRMLNEHTYWALLYTRWIDRKTWPITREIFFGAMPPGLRQLVPLIARRKILRDLNGQGLGRHDPEEILRRAAQDIAALADHLGTRLYFMGDKPTNVDASVYAFLASFWEVRLDTPLKAVVTRHQNLVDYCERMRACCFGAGAQSKR